MTEDCNTSSSCVVPHPGLPKCPEICKDCVGGKHIFHICNELGDLTAEYEEYECDKGGKHTHVVLRGWAEDDLWLENLLEMIAHVMSKRK